MTVRRVDFWRVKAGYESVAQATQQELSKNYETFDGHSEVWRFAVAGPLTGDGVTAPRFPNMTSLGGYLDEMASNPEIQKINAPFMADDPPARMLMTIIAR